MAHSYSTRQIEGRSGRGGCLSILIGLVVLFVLARLSTSWAIDYQWWKEMGQLHTWFSMLAYSVIPTSAATLLGFIVFWIAHARALKHAGTSLGRYPLYAKLSTLAIFLLALLVSLATLDTWTVVRYFGGRDLGGAATSWRDPVFGNPLAFYLFKIPFYSDLLGLALGIVVIAGLLYWIAGRFWEIRLKVPDWSSIQEINIGNLDLGRTVQSGFFRAMGAVFLLALAVRFFLGRYSDVTRTLHYVNCGHTPPVLLRKRGAVEKLNATATVLGLFWDWECSVAEARLETGDILSIYTDGITETTGHGGEEFGETRLLEALRKNCNLEAACLLQKVENAAEQFRLGEQQDDLTLVIACAR